MLSLFLTGQLLGGLLLERVWPEYRFPLFYRQLERVVAESRKPHVIFLGSSRFGMGVSEDHITEWMRESTGDVTFAAVNAAVPAGDPVVCEQMLAKLLDRGVKPGLVIIEICPDVVNNRNGWMQLHLQRQLCWEDVPGWFGEIARTGCLPRLLSNRVLPLYQQRNAVCQELAQRLEKRLDAWLGEGQPEASQSNRNKVDWKAVLPAPGTAVPEELVRNTQAGLHGFRRNLRQYRVGGAADIALEKMLATCQRNGITAILVGVPLTKAHRDLYTPQIEQDYQAYLQKITAKYPCRYVEHRHRLEDSLFFDNHHATEAGCMMFSRLLTEEVLAPWWREQGVRVEAGNGSRTSPN